MPEFIAVILIIHDATVALLAHGLLQVQWWVAVLSALVATHITIAAVTIYLHRSQAHRALQLHGTISHFFRFWLWLTTGMNTKEWVAIHRKHHAKCETIDDPHSPQTRGLKAVLFRGAELYRAESKNRETLSRYGHGTPDDWIERNLYSRFSWQGVGLLLIIDVSLFGALGAAVWALQMAWIPITAAGIINGLGHWWGYRTFSSPDASTNLSPWGILIGGEELHNNHHTYPTSAKLSVRPWEFDIGWLYIRILAFLGLAQIRKVPPKLIVSDESLPWVAVLPHVIALRYLLLAEFDCIAKAANADTVKCVVDWMKHRRDLERIWKKSNLSKEVIAAQLDTWYDEARQSRSSTLATFAEALRYVREG